ncbi:MAG: hypothetical protein IJF38_03210 [Clostridia bacterium]|nr:hypothetical protein [Clostridia bacterium]
MKSSTLVPIKETLYVAVGEVICSLITCGVFHLIGKFDSGVALGVTLGSLVIIINFFVMSLLVNRAIDTAFLYRDNYVDAPQTAQDGGDGQATTDTDTKTEDEASSCENDSEANPDTDEDSTDEGEDSPAPEQIDAAMRFASEQSVRVSRIARISFIARSVSALAALGLALILTDIFNPIATVIPLLAMRPIIMVEGLLRGKK